MSSEHPDREKPARRRPAAERNAEARAALLPLESGERPLPVTVAAAMAALLPTANLALMAAGWKAPGGSARPVTAIVFALLLYLLAAGLWRVRYGAVLAFEAFLGITLIFGFLSLVVASNLLGAGLALTVLGSGGWLFWKLIRVMGRIQATSRAEPNSRGSGADGGSDADIQPPT